MFYMYCENQETKHFFTKNVIIFYSPQPTYINKYPKEIDKTIKKLG